MPCPNSARERSVTIGFRVTPEQARRIDLMARTSGMTKQDYLYKRPSRRRSSSGPTCASTRCSATRWRACTGSSGAYGPPERSTRSSPGRSTSSRGSSPPCAARRSPRTSSGRTPSSSACPGGERRAFHPLPMRASPTSSAPLCFGSMSPAPCFRRAGGASGVPQACGFLRSLYLSGEVGYTACSVKSPRAFSGCGYLYLQPHFSFLEARP